MKQLCDMLLILFDEIYGAIVQMLEADSSRRRLRATGGDDEAPDEDSIRLHPTWSP